jgi:hypothetical protein
MPQSLRGRLSRPLPEGRLPSPRLRGRILTVKYDAVPIGSMEVASSSMRGSNS